MWCSSRMHLCKYVCVCVCSEFSKEYGCAECAMAHRTCAQQAHQDIRTGDSPETLEPRRLGLLPRWIGNGWPPLCAAPSMCIYGLPARLAFYV